MLQAADLTIKLNPADDVVIARVEIPAGTELIKEGVRVAVNVPAGHKIAIRDVAEGKPVRRYNQIIGYSTKPIRAGEHVHVHNLGMAHFERDYAYGVDYKPTEFVPNPATFMGIKRPDGRVATRNYVAIVSSVNCSAHVSRHIAEYFDGERLADYPEHRRRDRHHPPERLRHGFHRRAGGSAAARPGRLRHARQRALDADDRPGLRGQPDQRSAGRAGPEALGSAAGLHDPGHGRHAQDHPGRHRAHQGAAAGSQQGQARDLSGQPHHARPAVRRLGRLQRDQREPGARRGGGYPGAQRRDRDPVRDARDLRRRASADAPRRQPRSGREAHRAHPLVGGLHRQAGRRHEQQSLAGQQGRRPHHDPGEVPGRGRQGRHHRR